MAPPPDDERCAEARRLVRLDEAFERGDLEALRAAVDDPASIPNGPMPLAIGSCLVSAVYRSPLPFVKTLLELGADPNAPADDGFPPLLAALSVGRAAAGARPRTDVPELLRLLLDAGADPQARGINDYTALHMAVDCRNAAAVGLLLAAGADRDARTRIDDCETPGELALRCGFLDLASTLHGVAEPARRLRPGVFLRDGIVGVGPPVRRGARYRLRLRLWVAAEGTAVRWSAPSGFVGSSWLEDGGTTLVTDVRLDRRSLVSGLFYGVDGMRVGGTRRLAIAPHLAYADRGVPGLVPPGAALDAEVTVIEGG